MRHHATCAGSLTLLPMLGLLVSAPSWGQPPAPGGASPPSAAPREVPRPGQLEPGVDTSATPPGDAPGKAAQPAPAVRAAVPAPAAKRSPKASASAGREGAPGPSPGATAGSEPAAQVGARSNVVTAESKTAGAGKAQDRIELDATQITGNRELPKVLYIVPWKRSDLGDLVGRPPNSLLDEVLAPVDRDVFKRENRYYDALKPDAGAGSPAAAPAGSPESGGKP